MYLRCLHCLLDAFCFQLCLIESFKVQTSLSIRYDKTVHQIHISQNIAPEFRLRYAKPVDIRLFTRDGSVIVGPAFLKSSACPSNHQTALHSILIRTPSHPATIVIPSKQMKAETRMRPCTTICRCEPRDSEQLVLLGHLLDILPRYDVPST